MQYFIAGGTIRDLLLGNNPHDHDIVFDGMPDEFIAMNPSACKVESVKDIYLLGGNEYVSLKNGSIKEDLAARDFTINAFLLEGNGVLHMHPEAPLHLASGIIHPASEKSFIDDPARVFRAARFSACLPGFSPSSECLVLMREAAEAGVLSTLPPERVSKELLAALESDAPGNFLRTLHLGGCLSPWFEEFMHTDEIPAWPSKYHQSSVLEHIAEVMDSTVKQYGEWKKEGNTDFVYPNIPTQKIATWMAMCHDLGKGIAPKDIIPHHDSYELTGEKLAGILGKRLALPIIYRKAGSLAARQHVKSGCYGIHRPDVRVDLLAVAHAAKMALPLFLMAQAYSGRPNLWNMARKELFKILAVSLPEEWQNKGEESGMRLRDLRCLALPEELVDRSREVQCARNPLCHHERPQRHR